MSAQPREMKGGTKQQRSSARIKYLNDWQPKRGMDRLDAYGDLTIVSALLAGASLQFTFDGNLDYSDPTTTESIAMVLGMLVACVNLCGTIVIIAHTHTAKRLASFNPSDPYNAEVAGRKAFLAASIYLMETTKIRGVVVSGITWSVPLLLVALGFQLFSNEAATGVIAASSVAAAIAGVATFVTIGMLCSHRQANKRVLLKYPIGDDGYDSFPTGGGVGSWADDAADFEGLGSYSWN